MKCKDCIYWHHIGTLEEVYRYKDEHKEISEAAFANIPSKDETDDNLYGHCEKYVYGSIKPATASCILFSSRK